MFNRSKTLGNVRNSFLIHFSRVWIVRINKEFYVIIKLLGERTVLIIFSETFIITFIILCHFVVQGLYIPNFSYFWLHQFVRLFIMIIVWLFFDQKQRINYDNISRKLLLVLGFNAFKKFPDTPSDSTRTQVFIGSKRILPIKHLISRHIPFTYTDVF